MMRVSIPFKVKTPEPELLRWLARVQAQGVQEATRRPLDRRRAFLWGIAGAAVLNLSLWIVAEVADELGNAVGEQLERRGWLQG